MTGDALTLVGETVAGFTIESDRPYCGFDNDYMAGPMSPFKERFWCRCLHATDGTQRVWATGPDTRITSKPDWWTRPYPSVIDELKRKIASL